MSLKPIFPCVFGIRVLHREPIQILVAWLPLVGLTGHRVRQTNRRERQAFPRVCHCLKSDHLWHCGTAYSLLGCLQHLLPTTAILIICIIPQGTFYLPSSQHYQTSRNPCQNNIFFDFSFSKLTLLGRVLAVEQWSALNPLPTSCHLLQNNIVF